MKDIFTVYGQYIPIYICIVFVDFLECPANVYYALEHFAAELYLISVVNFSQSYLHSFAPVNFTIRLLLD